MTTTDKLLDILKYNGLAAKDLDYKWFGVPICWMGVLGTYFNWYQAKRLAKIIKNRGEKCIVIAHSNGCAIANMISSKYGANVQGLVCINPALDRDTKFADCYEFIHVYHNRDDQPVKMSKWLPKHPWGEMGAYGYNGKDPRVENVDCSATPGMPRASGHSNLFSDAKLHQWSNYIIKKVKWYINR